MEYHLHFDPLSSSLFVAAGITVILAILGSLGFLIIRGWKPAEREDSETVGAVKIIYTVAYGIIMLCCLVFTSCQTTGCNSGGNFLLLKQQAHHARLTAENNLLEAKMEMLELNGINPDSYDVPVPDDSQ
jgi:hypothetical protein